MYRVWPERVPRVGAWGTAEEMEGNGEAPGPRQPSFVKYEESRVTILEALISVTCPPHPIWERMHQLPWGKMTSMRRGWAQEGIGLPGPFEEKGAGRCR